MTQSPPTRTPDGFPRADREAILRLAADYWDSITPSERQEEAAFERELPEARCFGQLSKPLFVRLARWKSVRNTPLYEANSTEAVEAATAAAFRAPDAAGAILALTTLRGVALRTATAILHWMRPEEFPILDVRVLAALGDSAPASMENVHFYSEVAERVRKLAKRHQVDLRTIDRAVWTWDKLRPHSR